MDLMITAKAQFCGIQNHFTVFISVLHGMIVIQICSSGSPPPLAVLVQLDVLQVSAKVSLKKALMLNYGQTYSFQDFDS